MTMPPITYRRLLLATLACLVSTPAFAAPKAKADLVYLHGMVIPMTGPDKTAQAVAVKDGRIMAVGSDAEMQALTGPQTKLVDLAGKTLLPGFIDAHGHITMLAQRADFAVLDPPPVGGVTDIASLQAALRASAKTQQREGWLIGTGYDDAEMTEKRHPTRQELDAISTDRPILAWHVSGHLAVLNTRALEMAGMLHPAKDPPGGVIRREADGKTASGVIEEGAMFMAMGALPQPSLDKQVELLKAAQMVYAKNGLTTAQDGATVPAGWTLLQEAARRSSLFIDIHALPLFQANWPSLEAIPFNAPYDHHLRAAGLKLILDGSPQARTAWLSQAYYMPPEGRDHDYSGYLQIPNDVLRAKLTQAADHGWQVYAHVNGDAAIQQLVDGVRAVDAGRAKPMVRTIAIHAQTARMDQLKAMKALDIEPTFFASHTFYWGDWHREVVLGPVRADRISPQRDAFDLGLRPTIHNDAPVVPPDMIRLIWSAVTRRTRSGDILGPAERVTPYEALQEVTANAAYEIHEEALKGTLEPGKLADFVILNANPLAIPKESLLSLRVLDTVKEGRTIYSAP